jgi:hypothetical protein
MYIYGATVGRLPAVQQSAASDDEANQGDSSHPCQSALTLIRPLLAGGCADGLSASGQVRSIGKLPLAWN